MLCYAPTIVHTMQIKEFLAISIHLMYDCWRMKQDKVFVLAYFVPIFCKSDLLLIVLMYTLYVITRPLSSAHSQSWKRASQHEAMSWKDGDI